MKILSKITIFLGIIIIAVLIVASLIEKLYFQINGHFATRYVYTSLWFILLWTIFALCCIRLYFDNVKSKNFYTTLLHSALVIILLGAITTFFTSTKGYFELSNHESTTYYIQDDNSLVADLPFTFTYDSLKITSDDIGSSVCMKNGYNIILTGRYDFAEFAVIYDPFGFAITGLGYCILFVACIVLIIKSFRGIRHSLNFKSIICEANTKSQTHKFSSFSFAFIICAIAFIYLMYNNVIVGERFIYGKPLTIALLFIHVSLVTIAYILFLVLLLMSIPSIIDKKRATLQMYDTQYKILTIALLFLLMGIFSGATWANFSWGSYWQWDPKETWALITLLTYCIPLHYHLKPRAQSIFLVCAFVCVLFTFIGVNYLLGGLHSY